MIASENWRDLADFAIASALGDPDKTSYDGSNQTFCFSRLILLVNNSTGQAVANRKPIVIVASGSKNIITTYPTNTGC